MAAEFGDSLSKRELDVLQELATSLSTKEIGQKLFISPNTVKVHTRNIRTKLGATSRMDAVTKGIQLNLVKGYATVSAESNPPTVDKPEPVVQPTEPEIEPTLPDPTPLPTKPTSEPTSIQLTEPEVQPTTPEPNPPETDAATTSFGWSPVLLGLLLLAVLLIGWFALPQILNQVTPTPEPFVETELDELGWFTTRPLTAPTSHHTLTSIGLNLYLIGGETEQGVSDQTLRYNTSDLTWQSLADKRTPISDAGSGVIQGQIYVVGGRSADGSPSNQLEIYSPTSDAWRPAAALPVAAAGGVVLVNSDLLYFIGGESDSGALADAYVYDPAADGWRPLPSMNTARSHATGGILNNRLIIVGGIDGEQELRTCEQFDLATEEWLPCADMLEARAGASATAIVNELHVIGGGVKDTVPHGEIYDSHKDTWQLLNMPMLNSAESYTHLGTATVETNIYIIGGERNGIKQSSNYIYRTLPFQFFVPATSKN